MTSQLVKNLVCPKNCSFVLRILKVWLLLPCTCCPDVKESLHMPSHFTATQVLTTHHSNNLQINIGTYSTLSSLVRMYSRKRQPKQNFEDSRSRMDSALSLTLLSDLIISQRSLIGRSGKTDLALTEVTDSPTAVFSLT